MKENHSDCPRVAKHGLVLGTCCHVKRDPIVSAQPAQSVDSAIQSDLSQESVEPQFSCLPPRVSVLKEQGLL